MTIKELRQRLEDAERDQNHSLADLLRAMLRDKADAARTDAQGRVTRTAGYQWR